MQKKIPYKLNTKSHEYALGTWEMDLWTEAERDMISKRMEEICSYVDTAVDYNNDWLVSRSSNVFKTAKLISKLSWCHADDYEFFVSSHLKCLGRDFIDIMLIHSARGDWRKLALKMAHDTRFKEIGVSNFNIEEIEEFKKLVGFLPKYNELEINPRYTDSVTIQYCKENGIKVIAYGIFGGKYNSPQFVADYGLPYLIDYAKQFADILILKPESERHVNEISDVVKNFKLSYDIEAPKQDNDIESLNKSVVPMRYFPKDVVKYAYGFETYVNWAGKADNVNFNVEEVENVPALEMRGDFLAWTRFNFRKDYSDLAKPVYDYDFLVGDDGSYYFVEIRDDLGRLSKINKFNKYKVLKMTKRQNGQEA